MSVSISNDSSIPHISMSLGDIIKESKRNNKNTNRRPVKATPKRAKGTGATVKKTQGQSQRASAVSKARGMKAPTPKPKNISANRKAYQVLQKARRRTSRGPTTGTARMKRTNQGVGKGTLATNPNETLKITVQNDNRGPTGNASSGGVRRRLRRPLRQGAPRITHAERRMGLAVQQRSATTDRRAANVSAARGITFSSPSNPRGNRSTLRQPRNNPRLASSGVSTRLKLGTQRDIANIRTGGAQGGRAQGGRAQGGGGAQGRAQGGRRNNNNNNNNYNNNNYSDDTFANFRNNRPRNQRAASSNNSQRRPNQNNRSNQNRDNTNNNYNNGYSNGYSTNRNNSSSSSLNDLFRQQHNTQRRGRN